MKLFAVLLPLICFFGFAFANDNATAELPDLVPDTIITNGYPAYEGKAPYIVSLNFRRDGNNALTLCSGSIIANNWVLTAAHCIHDKHYVEIHYGSNWRWNGQYNLVVRHNNFVRHPQWPHIQGNDIGLIRTPHVNFNDRVNRIRLPLLSQRNDLMENWWAVTCGWGRQADGQLSDWLQCIDETIMGNHECSRTYWDIPIGVLCLRTPGGRSTCGGDSGSPLVINSEIPILAGVASFFPGAGCTSGAPAGFTRVTAHLDWIRQHSGVAYY